MLIKKHQHHAYRLFDQVNLKSGDSYACISLSLALSYCGDPLSHQTGHMTTICAKGNTTITKLAVVGTTTLNYNHPQDHQFWSTKGEPIFCIPKLAHLLCSTHTHTKTRARVHTHTKRERGFECVVLKNTCSINKLIFPEYLFLTTGVFGWNVLVSKNMPLDIPVPLQHASRDVCKGQTCPRLGLGSKM